MPDDQTIRDLLAEYLVRNHQPGEAVALAKKQLEDSDNPSSLNAAAYTPAQANTDLPLAEQNARKALDLLSTDTAATSVSEANARSFERTALLIATWDTLGFILLEERYTDGLAASIEACVRMLKQGRWLSVVFQHWNIAYFEAILTAAARAGAELKAAVSQVRDPIWSMHKKKKRISDSG